MKRKFKYYFKMDFLIFTLCFVTYAAVLNQAQSYISIAPSVLDETENRTASFKCFHNGTGERIRWLKNNNNICYFDIDSCNGIYLPTENRFGCSCSKSLTETVLSLKISNISSVDHNTSFTCVILSISGYERKDATIYVKVPVKSLDIMPLEKKIEATENTSFQFNCTSSYSRPIPDITWILTNQKDLTLSVIGMQTNVTDTHGFVSAFNTLKYHLSRNVNDWIIFCKVTQTEVQQEEIRSNFITINITYPPESKLNINGYVKQGRYTVIANSTGTLTCTIAGGNPKPFLTWKRCFDNEIYTILSNSTDKESVKNKITWHAKPDTDRTCTCQLTQKERNDSLSIYVEVMYPPTMPTLKVNGTFYVSKNINILLDEKLVLDCDSNSKPPPTYRWTAQNVLISANKTLHIHEIKKVHKGQYTCSATNTMNSTDKVQIGLSKNTIEINVLYPPSIYKLKNLVLVEGAELNLSCPIFHGNPSESIFRWTSERNKTWPSQYLTISNISRIDDMNYNCSVYNIMTPTGKSPVKGTNSAMFHLSVEYYATVKDFFVNGYQAQRNVIANETDNVSLICYIDSKPISNTSLRLTTNETLAWTYSNSLNYTLWSAKCTDTGAYFCYGENKQNMGVASIEQLNIFIRCSPRPDPRLPYNVNLTSAMNVSVVLHFPILAYPTPHSVIWQKYSILNWIDVTSGSNISISNTQLSLTLTIYNMTQTDFGRYRLIISNDVGSYVQYFYINAEDKPSPPTGFRVLSKLTTATTATVQWFPSFNGGQPQHFKLNFSKSKNYWTQDVIEDTGEPILIHTINKLTSDSVYFCFLYSVNMIGSSDMSELLEIKTKGAMAKDSNTSVIGVALGACLGVVLFLLGLFIGIYAFRRRKLRYKQPSDSVYHNTMDSSTPNPYEQLGSIGKDINQYSELQEINVNREGAIRKGNSDAASDTDAASDNLKIDYEKAVYVNMKI